MLIVLDDTEIFLTASTDAPWQKDRPTLLGLHGGPGIDGGELRYVLSSQAKWATVVVPDQRGHGRSAVSSPDKWTLTQWAADAKALVDVLGLENVILVGTSFGGFVVQEYLASYPGHVKGGVVVGASSRRASVDETVERYRAVGGDEPARVMHTVMTDPSAAGEEEWTRVCSPLSKLREPDEALAQIMATQTRTPEVNSHFMSSFGELDLAPRLSAVRDPLLVLVGAKDPLTPPHLAREIADHSSGDVSFVEVEDASHQVLWDQPDRSDELLREFASRVAGLATGASP